MWITKDSQIALFKVNILQERRWSIQGTNVQLITEAELVNPSLIFAIVYHLPSKLSNKTFDCSTPPILHVYGKYMSLGFHSHFNLLEHDYTLQHDHLDINDNDNININKIFIPICGVAQQLQFCFTNITNKPSFNKQNNNNNDNNNNQDDFGIIEIYGYSLQQIPAPKTAIPMLNLSTFFQYKSQNKCKLTPNDYKLLMMAAECDTMCAYISIQSRYFNQAKELLTRSKKSWLTLYHTINENNQYDERNSFLRQIREKQNRFKYNALRLEILIAFIMNEHNDFKAQIKSIINIIHHHTHSNSEIISDESSENLLPLQIISKYSRSLIKTLLLTSKDNNEFVQLASFKNIYFIIEKLGCNIKQDICHILSEIFEFDANNDNNDNNKLQSKPLHIQSIMRQLIIIKHNICDSTLNLISDCNFEIVTTIFEELIISNFCKIIKLEATKLAYCLRIFELCIDRLHSTPTINSSILTSMVGLMYHPSKRIKNISTSIWTSFLFILPTQILQTKNYILSKQICQWLCDMVINTDINREVIFPQKTNKNNNNNHNHLTPDKSVDDINNKTLLIRIPLIIINKMCEIQISWNAHYNKNEEIGLLIIKQDINKLCQALKTRILKLLINAMDIESYFDQFRIMLQSLDFLSCSIKDYQVFDELIMNVLSQFLSHLKTSSPSLMMLRVCVEFMEYISIPNIDCDESEENKENAENKNKFISITLSILHEFHEWIPHSIHDETFVLASKLIDINYLYLSHNDLCFIVQSLLSKYTLRSAIYQEFQHKIISKIYQRIQKVVNSSNNTTNENDKNLFKLITKILIFDAANFKDLDKMCRYFEFGYDWLQHQGFDNIYIHDFNLIFMRIITIFNNILFQCKNQQIVNISTDIITSIALHFSTSIHKYSNNNNNLNKIINILIKMTDFYINALEIDIGNIQFHCIQNVTLFLHSIILCSNHLTVDKDKIYNKCIQKLLEKLLKLSFSSHFTNITDLCLWTVCNFYYEIARYNVNNNDDNNNNNNSNNDEKQSDLLSDTNSITMNMDDTDLIIEYALKMVENADYKIRRWCGILIFLRFYFNNSTNFESMSHSDSSINTKYEAIYQQLLLDFDECVSKPLLNLCQTEDTHHIIQYIETSNLLSRPNCLLTTNLENEVLIEGRSDTASINQARVKNVVNINCNDNNKFPGLLNTEITDENELKIVDVDEVDDIEDISDDDDDADDADDDEEDEDDEDVLSMEEDTDDTDDDKENNKLLSNVRLIHPNCNSDDNDYIPSDSSPSSSVSIENEDNNHPSTPKIDVANDADIDDMEDDSASSDDNTASVSSSASMSPSSTSSDDNLDISNNRMIKSKYLKNKIEIPLLPLDQINNGRLQTNIQCERRSEQNKLNNIETRDSLSIYNDDTLNLQIEKHEINNSDKKLHENTKTSIQQQPDKEEEICIKQINENTENIEDIEEDIDDIEAEEDGEEVDQRGMDADDEREESMENNVEQQPLKSNIENEEHNKNEQEEQEEEEENEEKFENWINENDDYINFKRGDHENNNNDNFADTADLKYIDSFLQSISSSHTEDNGLDTNDISVNIVDDDDKPREEELNEVNDELNDELIEEFRRSDLNDYLVNIPRVTNRKKGWWMKYLNADINNNDQS